MAAIGMVTLGAFIGWVISYVLFRIADWTQPINVLSAVISSAVAGAVFTFIKYFDEHGAPVREALYFYPVGLAYGALCNGLSWVAGPVDPCLKRSTYLLRGLHVAAFAFASLLILGLFFSDSLRDKVAKIPPISRQEGSDAPRR